MDIAPYLRFMVDKEASDLFIYPNVLVSVKINGVVLPVGTTVPTTLEVDKLVDMLLRDDLKREFSSEMEINFAIALESVGRFRANAFRQRGEVALVIRHIKSEIRSFDELGLPQILADLVMEKRGLILVAGATGSGKSTTLSTMVDYRAANYPGHILTVEDPIEFMFEHKRSVVGQREVGIDTHSYENALKNAMREAPDAIMVGEIRTRDVMRYTISFAETGHLCLATIHAKNAYGVLERVVNFFSEEARPQLLMDLSLNLRAIICQRLVRTINGTLSPAIEILLNSPYIVDLIQKGKLGSILEAMERGGSTGMRTYDQHLFEMYKQGVISGEEAVAQADSPNNVALRIRLGSNANSGGDFDKELFKMTQSASQDLEVQDSFGSLASVSSTPSNTATLGANTNRTNKADTPVAMPRLIREKRQVDIGDD